MDYKCKACGAETGSFSALHRHIKKEHGLIPKDYYPLFLDRRDLFDNELIEFKDIKQYFSTNFNTKSNLLKWISPGGLQVREYCLNILQDRAKEKETNLIPAHVELKSLFTPCLSDYITLFGGVENLKTVLGEVGLKLKLETAKPILKEGELHIFTDTREQNSLKFEGGSTIKKLIVGDYCPNDEFFCNVFVERKSISDLAGTLTKGIERFEREIERAKELGAYLVVITEAAFLDAFEYSPRNSFSQKIGGAFLFNKIRKLMTSYDNIQFLFSSNRHRSVELTEKIFRMGEAAKTSDLEYLKDIRAI